MQTSDEEIQKLREHILAEIDLGKVTDMYTIAERMTGADKVIRP